MLKIVLQPVSNLEKFEKERKRLEGHSALTV